MRGRETRISDQMRQRLNLIRLAKKLGVTRACERMGKHRSYYYYWNGRYKSGTWRDLADRSRRPQSMPRITDLSKVRAIVKLRKRTGYGKERLHDELKDRCVVIPISTIGKVLEREGLLYKKRTYKTQKKHTRCYNLIYPGQRVQMDIKYVPSEKCPLGKQLYQYTVIDECTRLRYMAWHDSIWTKRSVETLQEAQKYFGFKIDTVQTDNGIEFTFDYTAELTARHKEAKIHPLDAYCETVGITHQLIPPGIKELNGKVERSHRTDDEEFYRRLKGRLTLATLRIRGRKWRNDYNFTRRHSGIGKQAPGQFAINRLQLYPDRIAA
jgi:transposase InsO family protein